VPKLSNLDHFVTLQSVTMLTAMLTIKVNGEQHEHQRGPVATDSRTGNQRAY
jgi:hypothetical protein